MKTKYTLLALVLTTTFLSCKDNKAITPTEERIEANQPTEYDNSLEQSSDTMQVIKDSVIDPNMKGQSDTHGRDTDAGR
ncbi:hypothetical protein J2X31_003337 [Flavobacterium arsenatis]|uniref:Cytochrome C551 n=1 Tax=Flavobacterium arsenatis TaxID=1484332 RepID=A0ABU1TTV0_9FLAO|nr:hypothetical protein [Flavobacterium arsenatis]MDR6969307.1 hypothetical protein [Flavobacterium arsenatis]